MFAKMLAGSAGPCRRRSVWFMLAAGLLIVSLAGAAVGLAAKPASATAGPVSFAVIADSELSEDMAAWVQQHKIHQGIHRRDDQGRTWLMVAWGEKSTGGYTVEIEEAAVNAQGVLILSVSLQAPGPEDIVTQVITYPHALITVAATDQPAAAEFEGAAWVDDSAEGLALASSRIFVQTPEARAVVAEGVPIRIKGAARLFEGTFEVVLEDGHYQLARQMVTATAGGPEWGAFDFELNFPAPSSSHGHLIFEWVNAEDGTVVEELGVPIAFGAAPADDDQPVPVLPDIAGHWAAGQIEAAVDLGFVNGYPDGTFRPEGHVTRAEFVKMVLTAFGLDADSAAAAPFHDTGSHWAHGYVAAAVNTGILQAGDYNDTFQ
ncbi:MAG: S-layer homology domain-containing protein, partial [Thermaerobacterales bacterium]